MKEIIQAASFDTPYNNFTGILAANGEPYPEALGGDCIVQAKELARRLEEAGYEETRYLKVALGGHHAVVCRSKGEWFFIDPTFFQREPASLTRLFETGEDVIVDANPRFGDEYMKIKLSVCRDEPNSFFVSYLLRDLGHPFWAMIGKYTLSEYHCLREPNLRNSTVRVLPEELKLQFVKEDGGVIVVKADGYSEGINLDLKVKGPDRLVMTNIRSRIDEVLPDFLSRFSLGVEDVRRLMLRAKEICGV